MIRRRGYSVIIACVDNFSKFGEESADLFDKMN